MAKDKTSIEDRVAQKVLQSLEEKEKNRPVKKDDYDKMGKIVAIFLAVTALLAVYVNLTGSAYSGKASSQTAEATRHMLNATDWWAYYQAHRLRATIYTAGFMDAYVENNTSFDNVSVQNLFSTLNNYDTVLSGTPTENWSSVRKDFLTNLSLLSSSGNTKNDILAEYLKGIERATTKAAEGTASATGEEKIFADLMDSSAKNSAYGSKYSLVTTMLVVTVTLGGIANITKKKLMAYICLMIGITAIVYLVALTFAPGILGLPIPPP